MFFTQKSALTLLLETPYQRIYKIQQLTRENRHCLRQASSRLVSHSSRIAHPRIIHAERLISSPRIPHPFSAPQVRWNSSNNESSVKPTRTLEKEVGIQNKASVEERQRKEPTHSRQIEETEVEDDLETEAVERPAAPGKREMRMHTLSTRMQDQPEYFGPRESDTIYVGNIFYDVEAEDLRARMEKFGTVIQAVIVHDNRGLSKGFGYVQFSNIEEARSAVDNMHLQVFEGRQIVVQFSHSQLRQQSKYPPSNTLFIGNIPYECTDRDIQSLFHGVKNFVDVRFAIDRRSGAPRGFCHAEFLGIDAAMEAKEKLMLKQPYGRRLRVEYAPRKAVSFIAGENFQSKEPSDWEKQVEQQQLSKEKASGEE